MQELLRAESGSRSGPTWVAVPDAVVRTLQRQSGGHLLIEVAGHAATLFALRADGPAEPQPAV